MSLIPGVASDQYGDNWFVIERSGSLWALGGAAEGGGMIRFIHNDTIHLDLSKPRAIRRLTQLWPA